MSKIKLLTLAVLSGSLLFAACKEDKLDLYDSKDSVVFTNMVWPIETAFTTSYTFEDDTYEQRFDSPKTKVDSLVVASFLKTTEGSLRAYIPVSVVGKASPNPRTIACKVNFLEEDGRAFNAIKDLDYKVVSAEVPANSYFGAIIVEFYKENMDDAYRPKVQMQVELIANNDFDVAMQEIKQSRVTSALSNPSQITVTCAIGLDEPLGWQQSMVGSFGYFSSKKASVLISDLGFDESVILFGLDEGPEAAVKTSIATTFKNYLAEMKAKGTPVYEDILDPNGKKIEMHTRKKMY